MTTPIGNRPDDLRTVASSALQGFVSMYPANSHGSETTLRSLSETQTRLTENMCQVREESWSWL